MRFQILWKIYFFVTIILLLSAIFFYFAETETFTAIDVIDTVIWTYALSGVYCFIYQRSFLNPSIWNISLIVIIIWDLIYSFYLYNKDPIDLNITTILLMSAGFIFLVLPEYFALYLLANRSEHLWKLKYNN